MTDSQDRSADIRDALREAGISEAALATAEAEFRPEWSGVNDYGPQDYWTHNGSTTSLRKHAARYLETHPFLRAPEETYEPPPNPPNPADKYWPTYANGEKVPASEVDADTMFNIQTRIDADKAAAQPEPESPETIAARNAAARKGLQRDAAEAHRAEQAKKLAIGSDGHAAANLPPGVSAEFRGHYSDEKSADEWFAQAGPDPHPWKP